MKRTLLVLALACACSNGALDAFTRELGSGGTQGQGGSASGGSASGGSASGGSANSGGAQAQGGSGSPSPLLLDNFEDGDTQTLISGGWWYVTNDTGSSLNVNYSSLGAREGGNAHALRAYGSACPTWCFVGLDLPGQPYLDARSYTRLSFWARAESISTVRSLSVDVLDGTNVNGTDPMHFRKDLTVSESWTNYSLPFDELIPTSGAASLRLDRSKLATIGFWVFTASEPFDILLDDVTLLP
ncbi:MAG: hypothetical protein ACOY0T_07770 [Myxococcota bacterium]